MREKKEKPKSARAAKKKSLATQRKTREERYCLHGKDANQLWVPNVITERERERKKNALTPKLIFPFAFCHGKRKELFFFFQSVKLQMGSLNRVLIFRSNACDLDIKCAPIPWSDVFISLALLQFVPLSFLFFFLSSQQVIAPLHSAQSGNELHLDKQSKQFLFFLCQGSLEEIDRLLGILFLWSSSQNVGKAS